MQLSSLSLIGLVPLVLGSVWPIPAVFQTGNSTTSAPSPQINPGYTTSAILTGAVARYSGIISTESFTGPSDYKTTIPSTQGTLSGLSVSVESSDETLALETDESYVLDVPQTGQAKLRAKTVYGALRGLETFSQLLETFAGKRVVRNTPIHIEDKPVLPHRGISLDTSRNFYPVKDLERTLDAMSYNKLNVLHWHIVDAQSWPVESITNPDLAKNGAYSPSMMYSYADVKGLIKYARDRGIRIIPEFDIPGHTYIVGHTYPDIMSCLNKQPNWDHFAAEPPSGQLNIAKPKATDFAIEIINEYGRLFTDNVFHLGGDEVNRNCWSEDPDVIKYLKDHPGEDVESLLVSFYTKVHEAVHGLKKTAMSWEETLFHSKYVPPKDTIIQTWIDENSIPNTVAKGYRSVASPASSYYLDCGHGAWLSNWDGNSWCDPFKTWMHIYNFDAFANITDPAQRKLVIGAEVALWSEQSDHTVLDARLWPRASAMAETAWSGKTDAKGHKRTTDEVADRMHNQRFRMVGRGIGAEPMQPLWCARNPGACYLP
ncbi:Glucosamine-6-phosphate isomerase (Glucosamine-6-phosphate deaminase) (GNPDA) (GlcN6P deaminase) [Coemansia sp. RSA 2599]|nr:Glucosamine-6-phosphate isomerase (Glucosamine-6-phosphate deaminase) (GNPDA) (GlcN6P deaminase) [Coemansia sp. RSA 2598]KAJ1822638.1 Glucosamine-6-phosphate isomerase (Glucosamine-6-phosphate deaminase) (GNPDA) (GlcN6P deaminase) [Coemansia sp. RSA 2599]